VQIKRQLKTEHGEVVSVSDGYGKAKKGLIGRGDYSVVSQYTPGAKAPVIEDGLNAGKAIYVKVAPPRPPAGNSGNRGEVDPAAESDRRKSIDREFSIRRSILEAICAKRSGIGRQDLQALIAKACGRNSNFDEADELCKLHNISFEANQSGAALDLALPKMS
jgi:hypothetical protein